MAAPVSIDDHTLHLITMTDQSLGVKVVGPLSKTHNTGREDAQLRRRTRSPAHAHGPPARPRRGHPGSGTERGDSDAGRW